MYRFIALLVLALSASADIPEEAKECIKGLEYPHPCCKSHTKPKHLMDEDVKECLLIPKVPGSCERDMCFATKRGYLSDDGTIKMDVVLKDLEEAAGDKDIFEAIKKKCLEGDIEKYGETDDCSLSKMANCIRWQYKFGCTDFSDEGSCKGVKDLAKTCKELDI